MKHIELLSLLCKNRNLIDEAYKEKKLSFAPSNLVESGIFVKIGNYYYLNEIYLNFVNTILARADVNIVFEDYEKELKRVIEYKKEYEATNKEFYLESIFNMVNKIYQNMENRDKLILSLIVSFERDNISDIDILINEAKRILKEIEELISSNKNIVRVLEELKVLKIEEFIKDILVEVVRLNKNIDSYLKRLREFIIQTEKKREFNKKLNKIADLILKEDARIDEFLRNKDFVYKQKIIAVADIFEVDRVKEIVGKVFVKKPIKKTKIKRPIKEVIHLIDLKSLIDKLEKSEDIFETILSHIEKKDKELINESVRVFVYILNHYDRKVVYMDEFNKYNVRIVKWK
jgi:hypothetical protein